MKLTLFVVIAGLCLGAVHVNGNVPQDNNDGLLGVETYGTSFLDVIKIILRSVKGVNCTIQAAINIKAATENCISELLGCGEQVTGQAQDIIDSLNKIITLCDQIIHLNDTICATNNGGVSNLCFIRLLAAVNSLYNNVENFVNLVTDLPSTGVDAGDCVVVSSTNLANEFIQVPSFVLECSQLTSG